MRYTASGLLLNQLACMFWAACYESLRRFTPGFELVFPRTLFPWLYAALAGSLVAGIYMQRRLDIVTLLADESSQPGPPRRHCAQERVSTASASTHHHSRQAPRFC
jgi:hypothetical protein